MSRSFLSWQSQCSKTEKERRQVPIGRCFSSLGLCPIYQCPIGLPRSPKGIAALKGHYCKDLHSPSHWYFGIFCHIHVNLAPPCTGGGRQAVKDCYVHIGQHVSMKSTHSIFPCPKHHGLKPPPTYLSCVLIKIILVLLRFNCWVRNRIIVSF